MVMADPPYYDASAAEMGSFVVTFAAIYLHLQNISAPNPEVHFASLRSQFSPLLKVKNLEEIVMMMSSDDRTL
uniref:Uncharacterized protein n=1 Tax=Pristionchus pacificus TaxID=54126 RepID=A0A2A6CGC7_PRIPA